MSTIKTAGAPIPAPILVEMGVPLFVLEVEPVGNGAVMVKTLTPLVTVDMKGFVNLLIRELDVVVDVLDNSIGVDDEAASELAATADVPLILPQT